MSGTGPSEVTLISEDGIKFQVRIQVVRCIGLFKNLLELQMSSNNTNVCALPPLQVPNVNSLILDKIIEYLNNYTASRENSALTKPKASDLKVRSVLSGIQSSASKLNDDGDEDDLDGDGDEDVVITGTGSNNNKQQQEEEEDDEFGIPGDDENVFDFSNFDEQSAKLFTPYEQNFFGSLDIPTLIEITKVPFECNFFVPY